MITPVGRSIAVASALAATAVAIYVIVVVWVGAAAVGSAAARVGLSCFVLGTLVSSSAYLIRFVRWRWLLVAQGHRLPLWFDLRVYLSGLALTTTPGKLGETVRSVYLRQRGVPVPDSLAAFFADRLSDVIAVALLGASAALAAGRRQPLLEVVAAVAVGLSLLLRLLPWTAIGNWLAARPGAIARLAHATSPAAAWARLWSGSRALGCAAAAVAAYGLQALVFTAYVRATGFELGWAHGVAIFGASTLLGAASMVPAGLGVMEAALVVQLTATGVATESAVAAALLMRASTLWCGLLIGAAALASLARVDSPSLAEKS